MNRREIPAQAKESMLTLRDGWQVRNISWSHKKTITNKFLGSILFLPGRGDHYEKYLETLAELAEAGANVTGFDWRGQGGSGRTVADPTVGHIDDFSIWISDLSEIYTHWKAHTPGPYFVMSHSMGGHLIMRALAEKAIDPDGVILSAPMLGLVADELPFIIRYGIVKLLTKIGFAEKHAWKVSEKPFSPESARAKILTHDTERYADEMFWWKKRPDVKLGPASWKWVEQAMKSTHSLKKPDIIENIETSILILATEGDELVDTDRIKEDIERLQNGELILFGKEAAHELLREVDEIRDECMKNIFAFIKKINQK